MALTPANILEETIMEAVQQPMQAPPPPPPRQYMTPGMGNYEMGMDGLPLPKGEVPPAPVPQGLQPPSQVAQQSPQPTMQPSRRDDTKRRLK